MIASCPFRKITQARVRGSQRQTRVGAPWRDLRFRCLLEPVVATTRRCDDEASDGLPVLRQPATREVDGGTFPAARPPVPVLEYMGYHIVESDFLILATQSDEAQHQRIVPEEPPVVARFPASLSYAGRPRRPAKAGASHRSGPCCSVAAA